MDKACLWVDSIAKPRLLRWLNSHFGGPSNTFENGFAFPSTRLHAKPLSVGISNFWATIEIQWGPMSAGAGLAILPTLAAAWFMQRYIIRGLTFGAVKG